MLNTHRFDQAAAEVTELVNRDGVTQRVSLWLETGDGYPESFTAVEMEAVYAYARLGRWAWFHHNEPTKGGDAQ